MLPLFKLYPVMSDYFDTSPNGGQIVRYQLYMQVKTKTLATPSCIHPLARRDRKKLLAIAMPIADLTVYQLDCHRPVNVQSNKSKLLTNAGWKTWT